MLSCWTEIVHALSDFLLILIQTLSLRNPKTICNFKLEKRFYRFLMSIRSKIASDFKAVQAIFME